MNIEEFIEKIRYTLENLSTEDNITLFQANLDAMVEIENFEMAVVYKKLIDCLKEGVEIIMNTKPSYYERNKEAILEKAKLRYQRNKEVIKQRVKKYADNNKDKVKEYQKQYHRNKNK